MSKEFHPGVDLDDTLGTPRRASSFNGTNRLSTTTSKRHSMPLELPPRDKKTSRRSWLLGYNMSTPTRSQSMPYNQDFYHHNAHSYGDHDFEDIPLEDIKDQASEEQPEPTRRSNIRDSLTRFSERFSLTPSEMPYPAPLYVRQKSHEEPHKAEAILGLRPIGPNPPSVPPKGPYINTASTTSSLPSHNKDKGLPPLPLNPLNGRTAWLHALSAVLVVGNCWGISNAFGLFQAYYARDYLPGTSPSTIAWIGSTQLALVFGLGVPVGRLVDLGFFRHMFHGGTLLMLLGLFASSWGKAFWSLWLTQGLITGFGMGMVFCSGILALMSWFDEHKMGVAMGLGAAGSCIGGIAYVLLARHFLVTEGFATTMRIIGGVAAVTMIPPNLIFHMRDQRHLNQSRVKDTAKSALHLKTFTSPAYLCAAAGMFLTFLGVYFGFVYIVSFGATVLHLSDTAATNLLIFMLIANLPGRFVPAIISDKCIGPLNTIIPAAFLSSAVIWLWAVISAHPNQASLTIVACFYGFVSAGVQVLYAPTVYTFCLEASSVEGEAAQLATDKMGVKAGGIFSSWFGSLDAAKNSLEGKTVLEIGCGQGDMTVALAWAVGPTGKVNAIDPAPLDYGSPETLREAQERISTSSPLGGRVNWIQSDPIETLKQDPKLCAADYIVLAHSLLYMKSTEYIGELSKAVRSAAGPASRRLLIAEWGMRVSNESAKAHLYAVRAQAAQPLESGNVQLYLEPEVTRELAVNAGWQGEERWIESPELDDGAWEVAAARSMAVADDSGDVARGFLESMDHVVVEPMRCMDVWTSVLH
ncbi:hypothetical protein MBLNU13_g00555t1 [Cladosporium sp. NU13]